MERNDWQEYCWKDLHNNFVQYISPSIRHRNTVREYKNIFTSFFIKIVKEITNQKK